MAAEMDVFLCFSPDTAELARQLVEALRREGIRALPDMADLRPDFDWKASVESALDKAGKYVIMVGPSFERSRYQEYELQAALGKWDYFREKVFIPILLGDAKVPGFLRFWEPITIDSAENTAGWIQAVVDELRSEIKRTRRGYTAEEIREYHEETERIEKWAAEEVARLKAMGIVPRRLVDSVR